MNYRRRIAGFSGRSPRTHRQLIADSQAQAATNCRLTNGQIAPLKDLLTVESPGVTGLESIFRMYSGAQENWLTWARDVDVARGPLSGDVLQRIYWTGDDEPRMSTYAEATSGGGPYPSTQYVLGVTPPLVAPTVTPSGGVGAAESRAYVYTFKTELGEESAPSPASAVTVGKVDDTWALTGMQVAPLNTSGVTAGAWASGTATVTLGTVFGYRVGERTTVSGMNPSAFNADDVLITAIDTALNTISYELTSNPGAYVAGGSVVRSAPHHTSNMTKLIYRTVTAANGDTEYRYVASVAVATTSYNDTVAASVVALNEQLPSEGYEMPPTDARGIIALPNGIMACFSKNDLCLSEPFRPHAWPTRYRQTVSHTIVGIGYFGTTIVIGTEGVPYMLGGVEPSTMGGGMTSLKVEWPCLSKRGMVSTAFGVLYPAPQGLAAIGMGGSEIVTRPFFTDQEWKLVYPSTFISAMRDNRYYAAYTRDSGQRLILIIDRSELAPITDANIEARCLWTDPATGKLYAAVADSIKEWDADISLYYDWMSKEFTTPDQINLAAAQIDADFEMTVDEAAAAQAAYDSVLAENQAMIDAGYIGASMAGLPIGMLPTMGNLMADLPAVNYDSLQFQLYVDNALKFSKTLLNSKPFRLPGGYKADTHAVRVVGNVKVTAITVAESMDLLKRV